MAVQRQKDGGQAYLCSSNKITNTLSDLIKTALYEDHVELGAKMVPYSGYAMPVSYSGLKDEHNAVRNDVGMFDVSHMGEFTVKGSDAIALLQYITSNDVSALFPYHNLYSWMRLHSAKSIGKLLKFEYNVAKCSSIIGNIGQAFVF